MLIVRGTCPNWRNERGMEGRGGKGRCFMLLDVSNKRNLVVRLEDFFWRYDTVFQMKIMIC